MPGAGGSDAPTGATPVPVGTPLTDAEYHRLPALSQSGMKLLLPPSCPALFKHWQENRRPSKPAYDFGHIVHDLVLGGGPEIVTVPFDSWRTKAAQTMRDKAYAEDRVPVLWADFCRAVACASAVLADPLAHSLFSNGRAEVTLSWTDPDTGVAMRGRVDWLRDKTKGRVYAVDLKTSASAEPKAFAKSAANFGYHQQQANYVDGIKAAGLSDNPGFLFVVVEVEPPHIVSVVELDPTDVELGRDMNARATRIFKACSESGHWPNYTGGEIARVSLPTWYVRQAEAEMTDDTENAA